MHRFSILILVVILMAIPTGCTQYLEPPQPGAPLGPGIIHRVERGETLWRIAREYGVELDDLVRVNRISDASQIQAGQAILIPQLSFRKPSSSEEFIWPVKGRVISIFGMRKGGAMNKGIDIQASFGIEILAARSGQVSFVHEGLPGFGKTVILDHEDGFATVYSYVDEILVRQGERVAQAQVIARVGTTGRTEVPALHFEIRRGQKPQNPFHYLP